MLWEILFWIVAFKIFSWKFAVLSNVYHVFNELTASLQVFSVISWKILIVGNETIKRFIISRFTSKQSCSFLQGTQKSVPPLVIINIRWRENYSHQDPIRLTRRICGRWLFQIICRCPARKLSGCMVWAADSPSTILCGWLCVRGLFPWNE